MSDQPETAFGLLSERWRTASALENESDRAVALIAAAFLDDALEAVLRAVFVDSHKIIKSLLGTDRPLGTFSARIKLTYALGHMSRASFRDLEHVRFIRNKFAHVRQGLTFQSEGISERCLALRGPGIIRGHVIPNLQDPRIRYIESTDWLLNTLQVREREIGRPPAWPENRF